MAVQHPFYVSVPIISVGLRGAQGSIRLPPLHMCRVGQIYTDLVCTDIYRSVVYRFIQIWCVHGIVFCREIAEHTVKYGEYLYGSGQPYTYAMLMVCPQGLTLFATPYRSPPLIVSQQRYGFELHQREAQFMVTLVDSTPKPHPLTKAWSCSTSGQYFSSPPRQKE